LRRQVSIASLIGRGTLVYPNNPASVVRLSGCDNTSSETQGHLLAIFSGFPKGLSALFDRKKGRVYWVGDMARALQAERSRCLPHLISALRATVGPGKATRRRRGLRPIWRFGGNCQSSKVAGASAPDYIERIAFRYTAPL